MTPGGSMRPAIPSFPKGKQLIKPLLHLRAPGEEVEPETRQQPWSASGLQLSPGFPHGTEESTDPWRQQRYPSRVRCTTEEIQSFAEKALSKNGTLLQHSHNVTKEVVDHQNYIQLITLVARFSKYFFRHWLSLSLLQHHCLFESALHPVIWAYRLKHRSELESPANH